MGKASAVGARQPFAARDQQHLARGREFIYRWMDGTLREVQGNPRWGQEVHKILRGELGLGGLGLGLRLGLKLGLGLDK
jgi:hypothetical protein